jgi:predicted NAD/FAD-dependent oxidoreductase
MTHAAQRADVELTPCHCAFATIGECFLKHDDWWHRHNERLIEKVTRLGWYAFAQEESHRLHEKGDWMERLGVESIHEVKCELADHGEGERA